MKPIAIGRYWLFGTGFRFLQDCEEGYVIHGPGKILSVVDRVKEHIDTLDLVVTQKTEAYHQLTKLRKTLSEAKDGATLSKDEARRVSDSIEQMRPTLIAELATVEAFLITPKRHDPVELVKNMQKYFSTGVWGVLPKIARHDFDEAGKCIAFDRPTAAAFHLLRGTEAVLKAFYLENVKQKRVKIPMWGNMIDHMRSKKRLATNKAMFDHLDNIRVNFRNPTQHPSLIYDIHEAENLLSVCVDVVNRLAKGLPAVP